MMTMETMVKKLQNIIRADAGIDGSAQLISQMVWMLFLKVYDTKLKRWERTGQFKSALPKELSWGEWTKDEDEHGVKGKGITDDELINFVNLTLFPQLKSLELGDNPDPRNLLIKNIFQDSYNYMKDGVQLRKVLNLVNQVDFKTKSGAHQFNEVYEELLKGLQSSGTHGEFYTPRALTDFIVRAVFGSYENEKDVLDKTIVDYACGTGGMLVSAIEVLLESVAHTPEEKRKVNNNVFGQELKPLPYFLATTNLLLHGLDEVNLVRDNSLSGTTNDIAEQDKKDIILMNPPYGSTSSATNIDFVDSEYRSSELSDLFLMKIMHSLKKDGKAAVIIPDGFLFGTDNGKVNIKKKLLSEFNLHTILRLPAGIFAPYTSITTNVLFFDNTTPTEDIWIYEHQVGVSGKTYTKNKQVQFSHFEQDLNWFKNKVENDHAFKVSMDEVIKNGYNLDFKRVKTSETVDARDLNEIITALGENIEKQQKSFELLKQLLSQ